MFNTGSATSGIGSTEPEPEVTKVGIAKLLFGFTGLYERWRNEYEARRYQDPRDQDPDYARRLRELEGQIIEIERQESKRGFNMGDYHEGGNRWDKWAMPGLVTLAVTGIIGNVVQSMTVSALRQEVADLQKQVERIDRLVEPRFRGG
jgi:hypothetical protein